MFWLNWRFNFSIELEIDVSSQLNLWFLKINIWVHLSFNRENLWKFLEVSRHFFNWILDFSIEILFFYDTWILEVFQLNLNYASTVWGVILSSWKHWCGRISFQLKVATTFDWYLFTFNWIFFNDFLFFSIGFNFSIESRIFLELSDLFALFSWYFFDWPNLLPLVYPWLSIECWEFCLQL